MQDGAVENLRAGYDSHCEKIRAANPDRVAALIYRIILIVT
jgi:hypothetical protein